MKGLFVYDLQTTWQMKRTLIIFAALTLLYIVMDMPYIMTPLIVTLLMKVSVVKVEEPTGKFLFTLPFSAADCAVEMYAYPLIAGVIITVAQILITALLRPADWMTSLILSAIGLAMSLVMVAVMLPVFLKFGTKNAGIYVGAGLALIIGLSITFFDGVDMSWFVPYLQSLWFGLGAAVGLVAGSLMISIRLIQKKTY